MPTKLTTSELIYPENVPSRIRTDPNNNPANNGK